MGSLVESLIVIAFYVGMRHLLIVPASRTQECEHHQAGAQQNGQTDAERDGDQEAGVDGFVSTSNEINGKRGDHDRQ